MTLQIYTMNHCPTCETTRRVAAQIAALRPELQVELIHIDAPGATIPPVVFSVPTYVLDGRVIAIGNPYLEHLEALIYCSTGS